MIFEMLSMPIVRSSTTLEMGNSIFEAVICIVSNMYHSQLLRYYFISESHFIFASLRRRRRCRRRFFYAFRISIGELQKSHNNIYCFIALNRRKLFGSHEFDFYYPSSQITIEHIYNFGIKPKITNNWYISFWISMCFPIQYPVFGV